MIVNSLATPVHEALQLATACPFLRVDQHGNPEMAYMGPRK